jgi:5-methylcytosine-specific restriction endonuclease McrA
MTKLENPTVLVLNRHWQAIGVKSPASAIGMMAADAATAFDIEGREQLRPVRWKEWLTLPVRDGDGWIATVSRRIRLPTVIIAVNYAKVPKRRPSFSARGIWERDRGICQYSGRKLRREEANIDHVVPRSRGGTSSWENCVLSHREINSRKADRTPEEAGLRLLKSPSIPPEVPVSVTIRNEHAVADWGFFLLR